MKFFAGPSPYTARHLISDITFCFAKCNDTSDISNIFGDLLMPGPRHASAYLSDIGYYAFQSSQSVLTPKASDPTNVYQEQLSLRIWNSKDRSISLRYDQSYRKDHHEMLSFLLWRAQSKFCSTSHLQLLIRLLAGFSRSDASEEHLLHTQASPLLLRLGIAVW